MGVSKCGGSAIDKVCLWFIRCILHVKPTTSNFMSFGEVGITPPSVQSQINIISYFYRIKNMADSRLAKIVFNELVHLHELGFNTWVSDVMNIAIEKNIELCFESDMCVNQIKSIVTDVYKNQWYASINDSSTNPGLRFYKLFKKNYCLEPHLKYIVNDKHRIAVSKFRCSSHRLEIERGRHTNPITPINNRLCPFCHEIDDELHFFAHCSNNKNLRQSLFNDLSKLYNGFQYLSATDKLSFVMSSDDEIVLCMIGMFIHLSCENRENPG